MAPAKKSSLKNAPAKRALALAATPLLKKIRGASHVGYDRVVFEFDGPVPADFDVSFVPAIIGDPSGLPVPVIGQALLGVTFSLANGHDEDGNVFTDAITTLGLKNVIQVVRSGDFEAVLSFGIGLAKQTQFSVFTLTNPSRVVIDIKATFTTVPTQIFFVDSHAFAIGQGSYVRAVLRQVIPPNVGARSLNWLFAGPTPDERAGGRAHVCEFRCDRIHESDDQQRNRARATRRRREQSRLDAHDCQGDFPAAQAVPDCEVGENLRSKRTDGNTDRAVGFHPCRARAVRPCRPHGQSHQKLRS
jgi:hypothetical protein